MSLFVDIEKKLGSFHLNVQFETDDGIMALLGASGSGKSMTLKCIAGIETPDRGRIVLDGVTLFDSERRINLPPQKRRVGYLFQQYALFPNMTVRQNVAAGLRKGRSETAVDDMIAAMGLAGLENSRPHQLSGGQQQRTALARILVNEPELLLLDEPFSALDSHLRFLLEQEVREVIRSFGKPVVLVSHDRDEVYRLSNRIAVIHGGRVETVVSREELFHAPGTRSAAILTGCKNISRLQPLDARRVLATDWGMELQLDRDVGDAAYLGIQMHDIAAAPGANSVLCRVVEEIENPFSYTILLCPADRPDAEPLGWKMSKKFWNELRSDTVQISLPPDKLLLLKE